MESFKIHIPLNSGNTALVRVSPDKTYGEHTGEELIKKYSNNPIIPIKRKPIEVLEEKFTIFIPSGELPEYTTIKQSEYKTRELFSILEDILGKPILYKYQNRALKHYANTSLQIPIVISKSQYEPLSIITEFKTYILKPYRG